MSVMERDRKTRGKKGLFIIVEMLPIHGPMPMAPISRHKDRQEFIFPTINPSHSPNLAIKH
jgi:hypothetical protein